MKNIYRLCLSALIVAGTFTSVQAVETSQAGVREDGTRMLVARTPQKTQASSKIAYGDPNDLITEAPAGTVKHYVREGYYWYPYGTYMLFDRKQNCSAELVEGDDGFVYLKNPYSDFPSNSYLKGKREGDVIKVSLPQPIYREESITEPGKFNTYYAVKMVEESSGSDYYLVDEDATEITYKIEGDKISLDLGYIPQMDPWGGWEYPYYILGLVNDESIWMSEGEAAQTWVPFTGEKVEVPSDVTFESWAFKFDGGGQLVKVGIDGNDIYIKGLINDIADDVFKGTIADGKATFASGQYLGNYRSEYYAYMVAGTLGADKQIKYADEIVFDYNAAEKKMTAPDQALCYSRIPEGFSVIKRWDNPSFGVQPNEIDQTPLAPSFIEWEAFTEEKGQGYFRFNLPDMNKDGYVLDNNDMYYNVYFDGELETFYTDEYTRLPEDLTDVPYNFGDGWNFYALGTVHVLYYYSRGVENVGIVLCNKHDGNIYKSPMTTLNLNTGEIVGISETCVDSPVVSEMFYSLDGRHVVNPGQGIYIRKSVKADGNVAIDKIVRK